ncbi:MAG: UvrD-helicase domain-containing protein [Nitrospirota bacterium]
MADSILEKDIDIPFPHFIVLKASAGSGKTHALTKRFVQLILSEKIPRNKLRNILAITFSNNAAREMKERILSWLKSVYFNDPRDMAELSEIITLEKERIREKAEELIEEIIEDYSDFQVRTIDSFMATVFKTSAIDFEYNPEFDILMNNDSLMDYSFNLFLRDVREGTAGAELFDEILRIIFEHKRKDSAYPWDPSRLLLEEIKKIYRKLASFGKKPRIGDYSEYMDVIKERIREEVEIIDDLIERSGLEKNINSSYSSVLSLVREGRFADLIGKGMKRSPVNKPRSSQDADLYNKIISKWIDLSNLINNYVSCYSHSYYIPYLRAYESFSNTLERTKKCEGKVFIEDINRHLAEYLNLEIVPDIYLRIGERIFHFLIDEFQDTSPIQWKNLYPLIENSLSQGGSLFVVGDTKQAIYGFRDTDYRIMKRFESENPFPSAKHEVKELDTNYRSLQRILDFNERVFKEIAPKIDTYGEVVVRSGLSDYIQGTEKKKPTGYVEVILCERDDEEIPEKRKIQELIEELTMRRYRYQDIAILTPKNEDVVRATAWLSEKNIPFISYSSLDIRRRKVTGEIVSLLRFLDSPPDDLSFATFILGEIFTRILIRSGSAVEPEKLQEFLFSKREDSPLYKEFQKEFTQLWEDYFSGLFKSAGYLPPYDLLTEIFGVFKVFEILEEEEATFAKILEVVKDFEDAGYNSLRDFFDFTADTEMSEGEWNIDVPRDMDAIKVMTIHKAKGLGFPVVVVLLYGEKNMGFDYVVEEKEDGASLLKINRKISICDPFFESLYHQELTNEKVNRLNSLYVGFTRAEEELYVLGVKRENDRYPFDLLPANDFLPADKSQRVPTAAPERMLTFPLSHSHRLIHFSIHPEELINVKERMRGEFIHRILFFMDYVDEEFEGELMRIIKRVKVERGAECSDDEIRDTITELFKDENIREYFVKKPGREIKKEQEFVDGSGRLFRMDRVVLDQERVTVIDFKTGKEEDIEGKYVDQMKNYMRILRGVYPWKKVDGFIAYVDLKKIERFRVER